MATTVGSVVERISSRLSVNSRDEFVTITEPLTDSGTSVVVSEALASLRPGEIIAIDYEDMLITAFATLTATVRRGWQNTTAAAHADNELAFIRPRFSRGQILEAVKEEIKSWGSQLYRLTTTEFAFNPFGTSAQVFVPIDGQFVNAFRVEKNDCYLGWVKAKAQVSNIVTTSSEGLDAIRVNVWDGRPGTTNYRVKYGVRFDIYDIDGNEPDATTDFEDMGIPEEYVDIVEFGAMWRSLMGKEASRLDLKSAKMSRSATDVREQASSQTSAYWKSLRDERIRQEAQNLAVANA